MKDKGILRTKWALWAPWSQEQWRSYHSRFKVNMETLLSNGKGQRHWQAFPTVISYEIWSNWWQLASIIALDSIIFIIVMTKMGCTCLIYPKPLMKKPVHKGGELWPRISLVGAPWSSLSNTWSFFLFYFYLFILYSFKYSHLNLSTQPETICCIR